VFLPGAPLRPRHVAAAALGFAGAALLVTGGHARFQGDPLGYLLALAAAIIWSTYSLLTKRLSPFPTSAVAVFCLLSGLLALGCHFAFEPRYVPSARDLPWIAWIGVAPLGAAFYLWDRALKEGDPRVLGSLAYLTPLLSTAWIAFSGGGRLTPVSAVAMVMIVGGAAIGSRRR